MASAVILIEHRDGLHARPAALFVRTARRFTAGVRVGKGEQSADAKQILQVLSLGITGGTEVLITAEGSDAEEALAALVDLVRRDFAG